MYADKQELIELMQDISSKINVPTIGIGGGYAPIGTIIQLMGTTAPQDYLACDGTVYNIADYPQLADYFESQFGESNHFGGNGTTTFAVPDLQGEFLRGTGTNSHTNQGSGANVGVHQDGTEHLNGYGKTNLGIFDSRTSYNVNNADYQDISTVIYKEVTPREGTGEYPNNYTSRPTNTSVLYCIKAVVAGEVYSTEERVGGTWIDGKKWYYKTVSFTLPSASIEMLVADSPFQLPFSEIDKIIDINGIGNRSDGWAACFGSIDNAYQSTVNMGFSFNKSTQRIYIAVGSLFANQPAIWTFQYTKITD